MKKFILSFIFMGALVAPVTSRTVQQQNYSWVAPTLVGLAAMYFMWSHWDEVRPLSFQPESCITPVVREKRIKTIDVAPAGEGDAAAAQQVVNIVQESVTQQGENNDGGASCGYHALKNAIGALTKNNSLFTDTAFIKRQFSLDPGTWRAWVQAEQNDNGEWIHTEFYANLIERAFKDRNITSGWSIINSQGQAINDAHVGQDIFAVLRMLEPQEAYKHVFFVNTADGYTIGQHGHWFVVIMEKEAYGSTTYTVMDSLGFQRHADNTVLTIIEGVHGVALERSEVSETKKEETKSLLVDMVKSFSTPEITPHQKEDLTSMILDLHTTLVSQGAVDAEVEQAMILFQGSLQ